MHLIMFCTGYFKCLQDLPYTVSCWSAPALCVCVCECPRQRHCAGYGCLLFHEQADNINALEFLVTIK